MAAGDAREPRSSSPARRARGKQREHEILDAAVRLVGSVGVGAVTHRGVAEAAGVPLGSVTYYFTDREELLRRTMDHALTTERLRLEAILESFDGAITIESSVELLTEMFFDKTVADPLYDLALFELFLDATRNPAAREMTLAWSDMIARLTDRVLPPTIESVSREDAVQIIAVLVDGLMLEAASNQTLDLAALARQLRVVVELLSR